MPKLADLLDLFDEPMTAMVDIHPVAHLPSGAYHVVLTHADRHHHGRFVKP